VVLRNGAFMEVADPGLHWKIPFIDSAKAISIQNNATKWDGLQAYSRDQQAATLSVSVSWHVPAGEVAEVYKGYADLDGLLTRAISRHVPTQVENVFGQYTAVNAVQQRGKLVADIASAIKSAVSGPVVIDSVQVENIDFSDAYEKSIEERMRAEVAVKTREQQLATEQIQARIVVTQAQATADSALAAARAEAESIQLRGEAEAKAIDARARALGSNPGLVELTKAERWNGVLPTTVLPGGTLPFIDAKK
jgi:regulator of protease activity HflC (stomatin/prohibitin superfamily)